MSWHHGDLLDGVAQAVNRDAPALIHGGRAVTWAAFDARSNRLARAMIERGGRPGDKVALYIRNGPEYLEITAAALKARLVHVNVNYRYLEDELHYIFDNSDARFVFYDAEFAPSVAKLKPRLGKVMDWIELGGPPANPFAESYEALAGSGDDAPLDIARSPDDQFFIYTGGTTGMPKGVVWRVDDLWQVVLNGAAGQLPAIPTNTAEHVALVKAAGGGPRLLPACPLMHGTGLLTALNALMWGGSVVTLTRPAFAADELWETVARDKVYQIAIVGDAFAKPMLHALDEAPGRYDLSALNSIISSGVMWSREVKDALLRHAPHLTLIDAWGSSEAVGLGLSITTKDGVSRTAKFSLANSGVKVLTEAGEEVQPGSGVAGMIARPEPIPLGYYKDPEKTAATFRTFHGKRYSLPGDWCMVEADGTLTLLGRGSVCINTAGEKVYPEEVEEALKLHPDVEDALVVGVPDEKWGQAVTGIVVLREGAPFDEDALRRHVRGRLAGYKTPKRILAAGIPLRAANGKADYAGATRFARDSIENVAAA
jgi:fatty-acyl-CoA synthase